MNPRRVNTLRPPRRTRDRCTHPDVSRSATRTGAAHLLADVPERTLAPSRGPTSSHRGWNPARPSHVRHLFVIDLTSQRVHVLGSTDHPDALYLYQTARTMVRANDGALGHAPGSHLRPRRQMDARRAGSTRGVWRAHRPDTVPRPERECSCGALRPRHPGGVLRPPDPVGRAARSARGGRVRQP